MRSSEVTALENRNLLPSDAVHPPEKSSLPAPSHQGVLMNNIIYLVGLIVVVLAILSFLGLR
ncbi:hypothetical protein [Bosea thiooxidans]